MEVHLKIIGSILILLALVHAGFPKYFSWKKELHPLSLINKEMMYVHTFFIALTILLMGILCIFSSSDLTSTILGKRIVLGFCVFWFARLLIQLFGYSSKLWRGKRFETFIHILFLMLWIYFTIVFLIIWRR